MKLAKEQIARQFSRAASTYDEVAQLQREMADRLIGQIPVGQTGRLVDFGCGTGYAMKQIAKFTDLDLHGIDIAPGMIEQAKKRIPGSRLEIGDIEKNRIADHSIDIAFSNAAIQWCDAKDALGELARVLKPQGLLLVSTFGPATLVEFKNAWQEIGDCRPRVHEFLSEQELLLLLKSTSYHECQIVSEKRTLQFMSVRSMFQSIKQLGATNASSNRPMGLLGRSHFSRLCQYFENQLQQTGRIELGFECVYVSARTAE